MVHDLLDLVMHLFFQIQNLQLLIFNMNGQEFLTILAYVFVYLLIVKGKHFCIVLSS